MILENLVEELELAFGIQGDFLRDQHKQILFTNISEGQYGY